MVHQLNSNIFLKMMRTRYIGGLSVLEIGEGVSFSIVNQYDLRGTQYTYVSMTSDIPTYVRPGDILYVNHIICIYVIIICPSCMY